MAALAISFASGPNALLKRKRPSQEKMASTPAEPEFSAPPRRLGLGAGLATGGALAAAPSAMLVRMCSKPPLSTATPIATFYKIAATAFFGLCASLLLDGGSADSLRGLRDRPRLVLGAAALLGGLWFVLPLGFLWVQSSLAAALFSLSPLWVASLSHSPLMGEAVHPPTLCALGLAMVGAAMVVVPPIATGSLLFARSATPAAVFLAVEPAGAQPALGAAAALAAGLCLAGAVALARHASPSLPSAAGMAAALPLGAALALAAQSIALAVQGLSPAGAKPEAVLLMLADGAGAALFGVASVVAPRYVRGTEVALLFLLELAVAPLLTSLRFGDVPHPVTYAGAGLIVLTLATHAIHSSGHPPPDQPPPESGYAAFGGAGRPGLSRESSSLRKQMGDNSLGVRIDPPKRDFPGALPTRKGSRTPSPRATPPAPEPSQQQQQQQQRRRSAQPPAHLRTGPLLPYL